MAQEFGKGLLMEVEEVGLEEVSPVCSHVIRPTTSTQYIDIYIQLLQDVRVRCNPQPCYFHFPPLDRLVLEYDSSTRAKLSPVIELISPSPGSGATHLLYHLTAKAILPSSYDGGNACVAIFDTDNRFSVPRLVQQMRQLLSASTPKDSRRTIEVALHHVHIFSSQSATSLLATLDSLADYFLHSLHPSLDRPLAFIALDSASSFYWEMKAAEEDLAFDTQAIGPSSIPAGAVATPASLSTALSKASGALSAPLVLTSHSMYPNQQHGPVQRSALPHPLSALASLRLQTQRVPVQNFAPYLSVSEAMRESEQRRRIVERGEFWLGLTGESIGNSEKGFGFGITSRGLEVQTKEQAEEGGT